MQTNTTHVTANQTFASISVPADPSLKYTGLMIFALINYTVLCQFVDLFGICTNTINIICFIKQGFKDPVNVSLFGLAVADLFSLATLLWTNICLTPPFSALDLPFEPMEFQHLTNCVMHTTFTRLSGWITALITMERCLCITAPLKVKHIVTSKRVTIILVCVFIVLLSSVSPVYLVSRLDWKFYPGRNKTLIGIVYSDDRESVEQVSYFVNNVFIPFSSFLVIIVCTIILVTKLNQNAKWRKKSTNSAQGDKVSNRNQKVAKMVVMISSLFVICFFPSSAMFIAMALEPELSVSGKYSPYLLVIVGLGFLLESINSSVNIFFYYSMSSRYKLVFRQLFNLKIDVEK